MAKNVIKEIIIVLLLALAIILILGVLLYEYVPINKIIPEKISYTTPENIKTEIQDDINVEDSEIILTYEINSTDLNNYKKIQEYVPGKKNPFSSLTESENNQTGGTTDNPNDSGTNTNTGSQTTGNNASSGGTTSNEQTGYLPDKGTK